MPDKADTIQNVFKVAARSFEKTMDLAWKFEEAHLTAGQQ